MIRGTLMGAIALLGIGTVSVCAGLLAAAAVADEADEAVRVHENKGAFLGNAHTKDASTV